MKAAAVSNGGWKNAPSNPVNEFFQLQSAQGVQIVSLRSADQTNRLTQACILALCELMQKLSDEPAPVIIAGNPRFFSAGADLREIAALTGPAAYQFSQLGQCLMNQLENFPAPVYAAIEGYCMGGGLDLALACHRRIAGPHAIFGHRGAALGLVTGWGGTQRLPRLIGKARALEMFICAEKLHADRALAFGLVDAVFKNPVETALAAASSPPPHT